MKPERIAELIAHHDMVTGVGSQALPSRAELLHLLRCARAWAELGEPGIFTLRGELLLDDRWRVELGIHKPRIGYGPDLLTATEAALRASRGEAAPRPEGEMARAKETT